MPVPNPGSRSRSGLKNEPTSPRTYGTVNRHDSIEQTAMFIVPREHGGGPVPNPGVGLGISTLDLTPYLKVPLFNRPTAFWALTISFMTFSWICCLLRLHARLVVFHAAGLDDFFLALAQLSTTAGSIISCIMMSVGFGTSLYVMNPQQIQENMKLLYIFSAVYPFSITFIKIALLFQYIRLFEPGSKRRVFCKYMVVLVTLWSLPFTALSLVPCYPVAAYWDFSVPQAKCWAFSGRNLQEFMRVFVAYSVTTTVLDFIIFVIPIQLFFKPCTEKKLRLSLISLFVLGLIVNMCSLWRMADVIQFSTARMGQFDPTWYAPTPVGLASLEVHLAAACAAMPVFWPVLRTTWNRICVTVTKEVSITREYGVFRPEAAEREVEMQSIASDRNLTGDTSQQEPDGWEPFVGDETTGLGENKTQVEAPAKPKPTKAYQRVLPYLSFS